MPDDRLDERLIDAEIRMEKSIEALQKELHTIRAGRATPALVERVMVEYYGAPTPLQSLATISAPEARLLVIQPYDRTSIGSIEKALRSGELGLNPGNDGVVIRIPIPPLTEERRREFVKLVHKHAEHARVSIRNIRRDEIEHVKRLERDGEVGVDDVDRTLGQIQKITDRFVGRVDEVGHRKEAEVLEV
jgi:ribosome recycling factor